MPFLANAQERQLIADWPYCPDCEDQRWCVVVIVAFSGLRQSRFLFLLLQNFPFYEAYIYRILFIFQYLRLRK